MMPQEEQHPELENLWRHRLTEVHERFARTVAASKQVLAEFQEGTMVQPDGAFAVRNVHLEESRAREEYIRVLRAFTELTLYNRVPEED